MASVKDLLPKTNCIMEEHKHAVACDDYFKEDSRKGEIYKDYSCCIKCGWNPFEQERRLKKIEEQRSKSNAKNLQVSGQIVLWT